MLTGSRSDVAPGRYGGDPDPAPLDDVAFGLGVQRHPEWDVAHSPASRAFFHLIGSSLRGEATTTQAAVMTMTLAPTLALAACGYNDAEGNATAPESVVVDDSDATDLDRRHRCVIRNGRSHGSPVSFLSATSTRQVMPSFFLRRRRCRRFAFL